VRARRSFTGTVEGRYHVVHRGAVFDRRDKVVKKFRAEFETMPRRLDEVEDAVA
jgi:hypothetical protein